MSAIGERGPDFAIREAKDTSAHHQVHHRQHLPWHSARGPGTDLRGPRLRSGGYLIGPGSAVGGGSYVITETPRSSTFPGGLPASS